MESMVCPKCGGEMEEGFRPNHVARYCSLPEQWMPGAPEPSFWFVTKIDSSRLRKIATFRCKGCGFLESYAREEA